MTFRTEQLSGNFANKITSRGLDHRASNERRLAAKLGELDEALGIPPEQTARELAGELEALAASGRGGATRGGGSRLVA